MNMRYVCHVGVHKTGTSLLQLNLKLNIAGLRQQGVYYVNVEDRDTIKAQMWMIRRMEKAENLPGIGMLRKSNELLKLKARAAGAHTILLSHEDRIGKAPYAAFGVGRQRTSFYPNATGCLKRLFEGFEPDQRHVLLYSRHQASLFPSLYSEGLRNLALPFNLEAFFDRFDVESIRFRSLLDRIVEAVPADQVTMRRFEDIRTDTRSYVERFMRDAGIDPSSFKVLAEKVRVSFDQKQADELMELTRARVEQRITIKDSKALFERIVQRPADPESPIVVPDSIRDACNQLAKGDLFQNK